MKGFRFYHEALEHVMRTKEGALYWVGSKGEPRTLTFEGALCSVGFDGSKDYGRHAEYVAEMKRRGLR